jgi:DhnA family fructose-bisphosphate aldolase class Ia
VPVIIAGGPKCKTEQEILHTAYESIKAGGCGLSIGRNAFQHKNPVLMVKALSAIVHKNISVEQALKILGESP